MSPRDRLVCLVDFVGMTLLCLLPLPNCIFEVCLPTVYASFLKHYLPITFSAISGPTVSIKSSPTRLAAETTILRKNGITLLPKTCTCAPSHRPRLQPIPL